MLIRELVAEASVHRQRPAGSSGGAAFAIIKFGDLTGWWHIDYGSEAFHWLNPPPTVDVLKTFQQAI